MMPAVGVLVPMYIIFRDAKLMDTFWHDSDINSYKLTNNSLVAV